MTKQELPFKAEQFDTMIEEIVEEVTDIARVIADIEAVGLDDWNFVAQSVERATEAARIRLNAMREFALSNLRVSGLETNLDLVEESRNLDDLAIAGEPVVRDGVEWVWSGAYGKWMKR